jgi:hypothetical protein
MMIQRSAWGARHGRGHERSQPARGYVIHHAYSPHIAAGTPLDTAARLVRGIEDHHVRTLTPTNPRIGYNHMADNDGRWWEGVGWGRVGAHAPGANSTHEGICLLVNAETHQPSDAAWEAVARIIRSGVELGHVVPDYEVRPHSDYKTTTCPGRHIASQLHRLAPSRVLTPARPAMPTPRGWVYSRALGDYLLPVEVLSDDSWWFVRWRDVLNLPRLKAGTPLSRMPSNPE